MIRHGETNSTAYGFTGGRLSGDIGGSAGGIIGGMAIGGGTGGGAVGSETVAAVGSLGKPSDGGTKFSG